MVWVFHRVRLIGRSICFKKVVNDLWDVHFSHVAVGCRIVNFNMNSFPSFPRNLFAILDYYFEVVDVSFGRIVRDTVLVNTIDDVTALFFDSIL